MIDGCPSAIKLGNGECSISMQLFFLKSGESTANTGLFTATFDSRVVKKWMYSIAKFISAICNVGLSQFNCRDTPFSGKKVLPLDYTS